jgi:hypothetical protein
MDELGAEAKREILKLVFPDLQYGGDPDVEKYFELRKAGRLGNALAVYNGALRVRYPDDSSRVTLLKLYRENDPRYSAYQESLAFRFADALATRMRRNLDLITAPLEKADLSDALRALKAVESVLSRLPGETEGALALLVRYDRFAQALRYRETLARRALDLVREYDAVSRADSPADYDFVARSAAIEERRRSSGRAAASGPSGREESLDFVSRSAELERRKGQRKGQPSYFDPSRIKFSEADKARVEISGELSRREDRVLAFCAKYWPLAADPAFERTVFLYSRKFGGKHFEVFRAIKLGRSRGSSDDEILSAVSGILTTSYNYSVSGDLYMQIMWRRLRARMEARAVAERLAVPGPEATTRANPAPAPESRVRARRAAADDLALGKAQVPPPPAGDAPPTRLPRDAMLRGRGAAPPAFAIKEAESRARTLDAARAAARAASPPVRRIAAPPAPPKPEAKAPIRPAAKAPEAKAIAPADRAKVVGGKAKAARAKPSSGAAVAASSSPGTGAAAEPALRPAVKASGARLLSRAPSGPQPLREIRSKRGSISDSIRKLSGRSYDVYKEIFLEKVRDHIHRTLLASQTRSHGIFDTAANEAEDQVFGFVSAHYDDPFMDWEHSAERDAVESLGFAMPSLQPIIESCFKKLR